MQVFYVTELMKPQIIRGKNVVMQIVHGQMKLRCKHSEKSNKCIVCHIYTSYMYGSLGASSQIRIESSWN